MALLGGLAAPATPLIKIRTWALAVPSASIMSGVTRTPVKAASPAAATATAPLTGWIGQPSSVDGLIDYRSTIVIRGGRRRLFASGSRLDVIRRGMFRAR